VHICVYLVLGLNRLLPHGNQTVAASNVEDRFAVVVGWPGVSLVF
jgi:hypothetical protein